jgi:poly-gamma-glutamate synthesis protein (capsule biosynthesis protein)
MADAPRPGAAPCDRDWLKESLGELHAAHDLVILTLQYWEFDQHPPTPQQRADFAQLAGWGADVVVGTQAHFPQTYAFAPGLDGGEAFVHYGLGNFYFDQDWWAGARFNLDQLFIYDGRLAFVDVFPGIIEGFGRPRPMTPQERENFWFVIFNQHGGQ